MSRLTGSSKILRRLNESATLTHILANEKLTRSDIRRLTALSTPTISEVLRRLIEAGLIAVVGRETGRPGPNAEVYGANGEAAYAAAISIREAERSGSPSVIAGLCDLSGSIRAHLEADIDFSRVHPAAALATVTDRLCERASVALSDIRHVQIAVTGSYNPHTDTIKHIDVPGFAEPGVAGAIASTLGINVSVDNDVNLAAVAERSHGRSRDAGSFALLWLGAKGIGLAIDMDGELIRGASGCAGEIGYIPVDPEDAAPGFNVTDLLDQTAILSLAAEHAIPGDTPLEVMANAASDSDTTSPFLARVADRLSMPIAAVIAILDPETVIIAGPVGQAGGEPLARAVARAISHILPLESSVAVSAVKGDAVLTGALDAGLATVRQSLIAAIRGQ